MQVYKILSLGWKGNAEQFKLVFHAMRILMILIIPVGLSIHTVTSWLFCRNASFGAGIQLFSGPYFVAGAFVAGSAAVVIVMYAYRNRYGLKEYFGEVQFDYMGKLLVFCEPRLPVFQYQRILGCRVIK